VDHRRLPEQMMTFDKAQAETIRRLFDLSDEAVAWLQVAVPSRDL
jgi:cyanate lyase